MNPDVLDGNAKITASSEEQKVIIQSRLPSPTYCFHPYDSTISPIHRLPPEVLLIIAEFLPLASAANLSITNRAMLYLLGSLRTFEKLRLPANNVERAVFLRNFDIHYPKHFLCHTCGIFHRRSQTQRKNSESSPCEVWTRKFSIPYYHGRCINICRVSHGWYRFYITMRGLRYSKSHGRPDALTRFVYCNATCTGRDSTALAVDNHLVVRERRFLGLPRRIKDPRPQSAFGIICPHIVLKWKDFVQVVEEWEDLINLIRYQERKSHLSKCTVAEDRCLECPTEYKVEIVRRGSMHHSGRKDRKHPYILVVSLYLDVGECVSPYEKEWMALTNWKVASETATSLGHGDELNLKKKEPIGAKAEKLLLEGERTYLIGSPTRRSRLR